MHVFVRFSSSAVIIQLTFSFVNNLEMRHNMLVIHYVRTVLKMDSLNGSAVP